MSIYKQPEAKATLMELYDQKLAACQVGYKSLYVNTFAGKTHVLIVGDTSNPPLVILHGINAGAPLALEAIKGLADQYCIYAIDTVGQATRSAETVLPIKDDSYGRWVEETFEQLGIEKAAIIGVSYGGLLLQKLLVRAPERVVKAVFVVPAGFVNGPFWLSIRKLSFPLMKFMLTKSEKHLRHFLSAFYTKVDDHALAMQRALLLGVKIDYRRPILLKADQVAELETPVYAMLAEKDIFFPAKKTLDKCQRFFKNFQGHHILKDTKHIPAAANFEEIEQVLRHWLSD